MSKKLVAGLVVVGGGLWYYDQNVHPIFSNEDKFKQKVSNAKHQAQPSDDTTKELRKLDSKARDFGSQLKSTANKSTEEIRHKTDNAIDSVKESDLYKKWLKKLDSYTDDVQRAAEEVENKPLGPRLAAKYIDFVNRLGQTEEEKLKELASSNPSRQREIRAELDRSKQTWGEWWSGKKNKLDDKAEQARRDAEQTKDSWFSWGQEKKDELDLKAQSTKKDLQKEKDSWLNWGQDKKDEAAKNAKDARKDLEKQKDSWLSWGQDKKDEAKKNLDQQGNEWSNTFEAGKQRALDEYYRAKKNLEDLTKMASEKANNAKNEVNPDDRYLTKAKDDFQSALGNLSKYGSDLVDQADRAIRGNK